MKRTHYLLYFFALLSLLFSCSPGERKAFYEADVSGIHIDSVQIIRYEEVLFEANPFILYQELEPYFDEFAFFLGEGIHDPMGQQQLYNYVTDPVLIDIYLDSREVYPDMQETQDALHDAFRFYRYHFPGSDLPRLYTFISGIDWMMPIVYEDRHLAISIDNYLGRDYPLYDKLGIPRYQSHWMRPESIPLDVMRTLAAARLAGIQRAPETLLEQMIHEGKKLYFLDCMFPRQADSLKIRYGERQMQWMHRNEEMVWLYILDNELLYTSGHEAITRFVGDAPFTSIFSQDSAPRTGTWIGWQIVREYMRRHPGLSLDELLLETDAVKVLRGSRYRPR